MSDVFSPYELALKVLLERLGKEHPQYVEALTLQGRLLENIRQARRYGDDENLRSERTRIREVLDRLVLQTLDTSFTDIAFSSEPAAGPDGVPVAMSDRVFVAYSHKDRDFAHRLAANLRDAGVPVWVDRWDIPAGADWDQSIDDAVYECGHFLIVLSPESVASTEVRGELRIALNEGKTVVPVVHKDCRVPRQLQLKQWVDFTSRGPDDQQALGRVLQALGVASGPVSLRGEGRPPREAHRPELVALQPGKEQQEPQAQMPAPGTTVATRPVRLTRRVTIGRGITLSGALAMLLAFFMPWVSCTASTGGTPASFRGFQVALLTSTSLLLFVIPLAGLVVLVLGIVGLFRTDRQQLPLWIAQIGLAVVVAAGLLSFHIHLNTIEDLIYTVEVGYWGSWCAAVAIYRPELIVDQDYQQAVSNFQAWLGRQYVGPGPGR